MKRQQLIDDLAYWNVKHLDEATLRSLVINMERDELTKLSDAVLEALHQRKIGD